MRVYKITLPFLFCFHVLNAHAQGLLFKSNDSLLTQRTSLSVFGSDAPVFQDHFFVNFDLSLWDNSNLGYVFNLSDQNNSYSLSYLYTNGAGSLNFNIDCKSNKIKIPLQGSLLKKKNWIRVKIYFDLKGDKVIIHIDSLTWYASRLGFGARMAANLVFGKNQFYTEVPNMAIKNLEVGDDRKSYFFPLNEWSGKSIHDSKGNVMGAVENPVWLINESYFWKPVYMQSFNDVAGLNFHTPDQRLFIFGKDSLITYDPESGNTLRQAYGNKMPVPMVLGKSIFNARENKCYVYELFDVTGGMPSIASLNMDPNNLRWTTIGKAGLAHQLHHHNIFYDPQQNKFCLFGGYGSYSYHNAFLQYNDTLDKWEKVVFKGDTINPRFFAATGPSDKEDELFLFGGYGNESGNQVVGGKQYYDLFRINLKNHTIKKCWNIVPDKEVFVPANNLIVSKDKKYFYVLCYPHEIAKTELKLYKFSVDNGSYEIVGAPIPVNSMRIESDINLFFSQKTDGFFCTVQEFTDRQHSIIKIYSLTSPPVPLTGYLAAMLPPKSSRGVLIYILMGSVITIIAALFLVKRRKERMAGLPPFTDSRPAADPLPVHQNAVYLMGEFMVFDRSGRDITHLFSPKIKQLFVLILLNSKETNGVSSKKISAKLWPDKDIANTKNIKGVTLNHLRSSISDINGIELVFLNDTYSFKLGEGFFCDYCFLSDIIKKNNNASVFDHLDLILRGPLLRDMPDSLLDDLQSSFGQQLTDTMLPELKKQYESGDLKLALDIAKVLLDMDFFNEEALKYQLKSFRKLKGIRYSRKIYDQFTHDYERSLGMQYHTSFDRIVH